MLNYRVKVNFRYYIVKLVTSLKRYQFFKKFSKAKKQFEAIFNKIVFTVIVSSEKRELFSV